jgi:carboxylesterase
MSRPGPPDDVDTRVLGPTLATAGAYTLRRPFWLEPSGASSGTSGVLLVHGFTGSPFEMRYLGEGLSARGHVVYCPRLAGHCAPADVLCRTRFADWLGSVEEAFDRLRARVGPAGRVYVCGLSLGGLLTLDLAARRGPAQLAGIGVLAAPLWFPRATETIIAVTKWLGSSGNFSVPKLAGSDVADAEMQRRNNLAQGAVGLPIRAVLELHGYMAHVRARLGEVHVPALVAHSTEDHTAPYACMAEIVGALRAHNPPGSVEALTLARSYHVLTIDHERDVVLEAVAQHVARHAGRPAAPA